MDIGINVVQMGPDAQDVAHVHDFIRTAEQAGFAGFWASDHVCLPKVYSPEHPTNPGGVYHWTENDNFLEVITVLTYAAAMTERMTVAPSVLILPQRNPVVVAKQLLTLHHLSGGRLRVGLGSGWLREEFAALGADFERRGKIFDDQLRALKIMFTEHPAQYESEWIHLGQSAGFKPLPDADHPINVYIGGRLGTEHQTKRVTQFAGWHSIHESPEHLAMKCEELRQAFETAGRDPDELRIIARTELDLDAPSRDHVELMERYRDAGAATFVIDNRTLDGREATPIPLGDKLKRFIADVLPEFPPEWDY